jgi:rare lipoprotein A
VVGDPYQVAGRTYYPREDPNYDKVGTASWYGPSFHRRMTSNGEWFDMHYMSAAHPTLPLPSYVKVTNLENRRTIVVRVNDRGPFVGTRIIDLSKKSADALGFRGKGTAKVRVTYIGRAPLNDKGSHLLAMNRSLKGGGAETMFAAVEKPRKVVREKPKQVVETEVAAVEAAEAIEREPVVSAAPAAGYFVQVASYSDPANAGRTKSNLAGLGHVVITPVEADLGTFYRVRIGPLASPEEASMTLARIRAAGHSDARVVAQN